MDYPVRSYLVYADTEEEMESWILAINSEIKPAASQRGGGASIKIDDKVFDEVQIYILNDLLLNFNILAINHSG